LSSKKELKDDEGGALVGLCSHDPHSGHIRIQLDPEGKSLGIFNTLIHEALHGSEYVYAYDLEHHQIYVMASAICQFLVSTGLIDPLEFEARLRALSLK
jgi:hypothetical protein